MEEMRRSADRPRDVLAVLMSGNGHHCFIYGAKVNVEGEGCNWAIGEQIKRLIPFWCSEKTQRLNDVVFLTLETKMANWKDDSMTMGARSVLRSELDCLPDFFVAAKDVQFRREFRTLASEDSFCDVGVVFLFQIVLSCL